MKVGKQGAEVGAGEGGAMAWSGLAQGDEHADLYGQISEVSSRGEQQADRGLIDPGRQGSFLRLHGRAPVGLDEAAMAEEGSLDPVADHEGRGLGTEQAEQLSESPLRRGRS